MNIVVKKMGGENAAELYKSCQNILHDHRKLKKQIVVVSAIRSPKTNTTDYLIEMGNHLSIESIDEQKVMSLIQTLRNFHIQISQQKLGDGEVDIQDFIHGLFDELEEKINYYLRLSNRKIIPNSGNDYSISIEGGEVFSLLGFGEYISSKILAFVLSHIGDDIECQSVDLSGVLRVGETNHLSESEIFTLLEEKIFGLTSGLIVQGIVPILSGYVGAFTGGIESAIGRGYSDATAAICVVSYAHKGYEGILEIQKSVKGVLSADPRVLDNPNSAKLLREIDYVTAREITGDNGANAKLLHSQAIREEVQDAGVKIHLFDPFSTGSENGTWVVPQLEENSENLDGELFFGGKDNIVFCSVSSGKMFESGVLSSIFTVVKEYFSVDIISASETEVSFTVDASSDIREKLESMNRKLRDMCNISQETHMEFVEFECDKALLFCIGQHMRNNIGLLAKVSNILAINDINIEIVSQGRLQRAMVFGIHGNDLSKAINVLHEAFVAQTNIT